MTKKSQSRQARDRAMKAAAQQQAQPQVRTQQHRPANLGGFKPTENGGFKLSPADRILAECRQGLGLIPEEKKDTCWDDLMAVYFEARGLLLQHTSVSGLLADKDLQNYLDDPVTFNLNVKQFGVDVGQMHIELQSLRALHVDKKGGSTSPDDLIYSIEIFEQYRLWMTRHDGVIKPVVMQILEQTNAAELKRAQAHQKAAEGMIDAEVPTENLDAGALDVNQVTDVAFQEVPVSGHIVNENAKPLRGMASPIYQIDEAGLFPAGESAHHPQHHKHEHHASA
jgi:hypothetical protein